MTKHKQIDHLLNYRVQTRTWRINKISVKLYNTLVTLIIKYPNSDSITSLLCYHISKELGLED